MKRTKRVAKLVASSIVLCSFAGIIIVGKKQRLLAYKRPIPILEALPADYIASNDYGSIVSSNDHLIPRATVEHITLNVPKTKFGDEKIVRHGRVVYYPHAQATILICHGFMTDKYDVGFLRHLFPQGKYNFMTFDFRAHGDNCNDQCCTLGRDEALDVITAGHFIKTHSQLKDKPVIVYAFSMGAVAAIEAQSQDNSLFSAMILDCPFDSSENMIKRSLENLQFTFLGYDFSVPACNLLQKYAFHPYVQALIKGILKTISHFDTKNIDVRIYPINPAQSAQEIDVPCLFIHCKNDEKISVQAVKTIYECCGSCYKKLWLTNGRRHFDSYFYNPEQYIKEVRGFIETVVNKTYSNKPKEQIIEDQDELLAQI